MFDLLPFPLRVLAWPLRFVALLGLGVIGALLVICALAMLFTGGIGSALILGLLAGLCFEVRRLIA